MRKMFVVCAALAAVALLTSAASAQRPEQPGGQPGGQRGRFTPPVLAALDADEDGEISAKEIENAVKALKGLDKDGDGKLSRTELMGERPTGGRPGGAPGGTPGGTPGGPGGGAEGFVTRLLANDKDGVG